MKNDYHYIDPDYAYTDPETGVLRNCENIDDDHLLHIFESIKVGIRLEELQTNPIKIKNSYTLLDVHKHLFQDIYSWAGKIRTVEISKDGNPFFPLSHFRNAFTSIFCILFGKGTVAHNANFYVYLPKKKNCRSISIRPTIAIFTNVICREQLPEMWNN